MDIKRGFIDPFSFCNSIVIPTGDTCIVVGVSEWCTGAYTVSTTPPSWEVRNCSYGHHIDASDYSGNTKIVKVFNNVWIYAVLLVLYILLKVMKATSLKHVSCK
jgi:hypothetical protein